MGSWPRWKASKVTDSMSTNAAEQALAPSSRRPKRAAGLREGARGLTLLPAIAILVVFGAVTTDSFLTGPNIWNLLETSAVLGVVVVAQTLILLVGKFDLSLESVVALAPIIAIWIIMPEASNGLGIGLPPLVAMLVALLVGAGVGLINGFLVVKLQLNAFIVTLAMLILLRGVVMGVSQGTTFFDLPAEFMYLGTARWLGVPASVVVVGLLFVAAATFLRYHRVGRSIYAIGGNPAAARAAGIRVDRIIIGVYIVGGLLAGFAGLLLSARIASVTASQGQNLIFTVFAAAVIGGISLDGGRGRMIGALSGVLLLGIVENILTLSQVQAFWIDACFGAIIIVALLMSRVAGRRQGASG
jgi:simple sugar transport system permease protein